MSISNKHETILTETITQLESDGYKVIRTENKSPTCIAFNNKETVAITILTDRDKTITYLEDKYHMYDRIDRILFKKPVC